MQRITGKRVGGSYLVIVLMIAVAILSSPLASAGQSSEPSPTPTPIIDAPVIPAPVTPQPEITPTEEPPADAEPIALPGNPPAPDAPILPQPVTPKQTIEAEGDVVDEGTSEPTQSPTPEPAAVVTWSQPDSVVCELAAGDAAGLHHAESRTYHCNVAAEVSSNLNMPPDMVIAWEVSLDFADGHALQLPSHSHAEVTSQITEGSSTQYVITHPWQQGSVQALAFDVVIARTTCAVGEQMLGIDASPEISSETGEVEIVQSGDPVPATNITTVFLPNLAAPEVSMSAVDFGTLKWDGKSWGSARATSTITVTNPDPCGISQAHSIDLHISADEPGMQPSLVSVEAGRDITVTEGGGTSIATIPAGFSGSTTIEVEFELAPTVDTPVGDHTFGFEVTVSAVP